MRRRVIRVTLDGWGSLVNGYGSRDLVIAVTGRAPVWSNLSKGWSVVETTARDIIAVAEVRGYDVEITGPRAAAAARPANCAAPCTVDEPPVEHVDPGAGLW